MCAVRSCPLSTLPGRISCGSRRAGPPTTRSAHSSPPQVPARTRCRSIRPSSRPSRLTAWRARSGASRPRLERSACRFRCGCVPHDPTSETPSRLPTWSRLIGHHRRDYRRFSATSNGLETIGLATDDNKRIEETRVASKDNDVPNSCNTCSHDSAVTTCFGR